MFGEEEKLDESNPVLDQPVFEYRRLHSQIQPMFTNTLKGVEKREHEIRKVEIKQEALAAE